MHAASTQPKRGERLIQLTLMLGATLCATSLGSCVMDPVHDSLVKSLGPDTDLPESEYHRSGQPCVECHSYKGPAKNKFVVGGTLYYLPDDGKTAPVPVDGAEITILDARGSLIRVRSNCRGNFFVRACSGTCPFYGPQEYAQYADVYFPFFVSVSKQTEGGYKAMNGHVGRDGSCAGCHKDPPFYDSPGHVFLFSNPGDIAGGKVPAPPICPPPPGPATP